MADINDWQRRSMKKGATPSANSSSKLSGPQGSLHSKIAKPTHACGGQVSMGSMAMGKPAKGYNDGGMVEYFADGGVVSGTKEYDEAIEKYRDEPRYHGYEDFAPSGRVALDTYNRESAKKKDFTSEPGVPRYSKSAAKKAQEAQREYADELQRETRGKIPRARLADGGEVTEEADKQAGLEASKGESVGFFERLKMGNIDEPGSEAYRRFGAGRVREDRAETDRFANRAATVNTERPEPVSAEDIAPAAPKPRAQTSTPEESTVQDLSGPKVAAVAKPVARKPDPGRSVGYDESKAETNRLSAASRPKPLPWADSKSLRKAVPETSQNNDEEQEYRRRVAEDDKRRARGIKLAAGSFFYPQFTYPLLSTIAGKNLGRSIRDSISSEPREQLGFGLADGGLVKRKK